ncbi:MAG: hypothetical protein ACPL4K_06110, partial [Candidatus Margulisiibacteriota bacterium]
MADESLITKAYKVIEGLLFSSLSVACTSSEKTGEKPAQAQSSGEETIALNERDIAAITGGICNLHVDQFNSYNTAAGGLVNALDENPNDNTTPTNEENFWYAVAHYLVMFKYSPNISYFGYNPPEITKTISELAPNQKEALVKFLARHLIEVYKSKSNTRGDNYLYTLLPTEYQNPYNLLCKIKNPNLYDLIQRTTFSYQVPLNLTKDKMLELIKEVKETVPVVTKTILDENSIISALQNDEALRNQVLNAFPQPFVSICTVTPNKGKVGDKVTVNLSGAFSNIYQNNAYVNGLKILFDGIGEAALPQTPTVSNEGLITSLPVELTIPQTASPGPKDLVVKIGETILFTFQ